VGHLRANGFTVNDQPVSDMDAVKRRHHVPLPLSSCHTATVDGYVIEGHVPADLIDRLLAARPRVIGLTVPGMPAGAPGMDDPGQPAQRYDVLTFDAKGQTKVFATR
jgi:hypothetical protein